MSMSVLTHPHIHTHTLKTTEYSWSLWDFETHLHADTCSGSKIDTQTDSQVHDRFMHLWVPRPRYTYPWSEILLGNAQLLKPPDSCRHFCPCLRTPDIETRIGTHSHTGVIVQTATQAHGHRDITGQDRYWNARVLLTWTVFPAAKVQTQIVTVAAPQSTCPWEHTGHVQTSRGKPHAVTRGMWPESLHTHSPPVDLSPSSKMDIGRCSGLKTFGGCICLSHWNWTRHEPGPP